MRGLRQLAGANQARRERERRVRYDGGGLEGLLDGLRGPVPGCLPAWVEQAVIVVRLLGLPELEAPGGRVQPARDLPAQPPRRRRAVEVLPSLASPQRRALEVALLRIDPEGAEDHRAVGVAFMSALEILASREPLVLAVDDLQWLDSPSARVMAFALRRLRTEPVRLLGSVRLGTDTGITSVQGSGGGRESNPPAGISPHTGFEDRGAHQALGRLRAQHIRAGGAFCARPRRPYRQSIETSSTGSEIPLSSTVWRPDSVKVRLDRASVGAEIRISAPAACAPILAAWLTPVPK
jgi:hypothetical protein